MGKKKQSEKPSVEDALEKKYGKVFQAGSNLLEEKKEIISISPAIDMILGGGIPMGSFVVITGKPKIGKSSLCLHYIKKAQAKGHKTYYFDVEARLKKRDLEGSIGLKTDKENFVHIRSQKGNILYAEDYLDILNELSLTQENCIFIIDSISQLCSKSRVKNTIGDRFRDDVPLLLADMTKRISNLLPITNNTLVCITHLIANQGGMSRSMWSEASGQKVQYQADIKLKATWSEPHKVGEDQIGQLVHWECGTTALDAAPCKKGSSLLRYGYGIDEEFEILKMCMDIGIVKKGGAWITFPNEEKLQGIEKARSYLVDNPKVYQKLKDTLNTMLGF